jgi:hypothetical protein
MEERLGSFFILRETPTCEKENKASGRLVRRGNDFGIANCPTKIPAIFQEAFGNFRVMSKCIFLFPRFLVEPSFGNTALKHT